MRTVRVGEPRERLVDRHIRELRTMRIEPIFPVVNPERYPGMRMVLRRATKRPFGLVRAIRKRRTHGRKANR